MTAAELIAAAQEDHFARLKWQVLRRLGICPASIRARLMPRRTVLRLACQLVLDAGGTKSGGSVQDKNPNFDMARFERLAGG